MFDHVDFERSEEQPASDSEYEASGVESSLSTRVEYHWSFEYRLKWKTSMLTRRSSNLTKASKKVAQRSPSPNEEVIQRKLRGRTKRNGLKKIETSDSRVHAEEWRDRDILDVINSTLEAKGVGEEDEERFVEGLCTACRSLYGKAKKLKRPMENKLLDKDPKSLTCDQKLLIHVQLVKKRLKATNGAKRNSQCGGKLESSACTRPHSFLQRNLRRCLRMPMKQMKKNRGKRRRVGSQGPCVAKQQHLHSNHHLQNISVSSTDKSSILSDGLEGQIDQKVSDEDESNTNLTVQLIPANVSLEPTEPRELPSNQKAAKKARGFRDLLAQLRSNSSMVMKESH
ncbi:Alpha-amylase I [Dissostichus eleginoides]|uniref:Alpha-amylase I n=1 Tax=Dissostichus eleginoides TaxID=100907 RepID=A0AAD9EVK1_DISEL|nr:Alpha-amylase I [Dissostichus eleginoides]